jgi:tetratricopeptide (TPR) repeat protein
MYDQLLLNRAASAEQTKWVFGSVSSSEQSQDSLHLDFEHENYTPFSSIVKTFQQLAELTNSTNSDEYLHIIDEITKICDASSSKVAQGSLQDGMMQHRGVIVALRRISREGAELSSLIHRSASLLIVLIEKINTKLIVLDHVDRIDRLSLKIVGRANLMIPESNKTFWEWKFASDEKRLLKPDRTGDKLNDLWNESRKNLFHTLKEVLSPVVNSESHGNLQFSHFPVTDELKKYSMLTASSWLTYLCYDTCFIWAKSNSAYTDTSNPNYADLRRLLAVAAMNVGEHYLAVSFLNEAFEAAKDSTVRAHISFMTGLIYAKRLLDLEKSNECYEIGLKQLTHVSPSDPGDPNVERAWINNAIALNTLVSTRLKGAKIDSSFIDTYQFLVNAFELVKTGQSAERMYLRYNLLANMASFMMIQEKYEIALKLIEDTFTPLLEDVSLNDKSLWRATSLTRLGTIHAKLGNLELASNQFQQSLMLIRMHKCELREEILERSVGTLHLLLGRWEEANLVFRNGYIKARNMRSRKGVIMHAKGLVIANRELGNLSEAKRIYNELIGTEAIWLAGEGVGASVGVYELEVPRNLPGIALSIPEVDLEDLGSISVSSILKGESMPKPNLSNAQ